VTRFVGDARDLTPAEAQLPPQTATELLRRLGVEGLEHNRQASAVKAWLGQHEPPPLLVASLVNAGLADPALLQHDESADFETLLARVRYRLTGMFSRTRDEPRPRDEHRHRDAS
jgi:hypothetical protein